MSGTLVAMDVGMVVPPAAQVHAAYVDIKAWAKSASTRRLRRRAHRLRRHGTDHRTMAKVKALRDELRSRGES